MKSSSLSSPTKSRGIGGRISQVRFPFTQSKFANSLGIHANTLIEYESEEKLPDSEFLTRIYEVYRVDPIWLLTGESAKVFPLAENTTFHNDYKTDSLFSALVESTPEKWPVAIKNSCAMSQLKVEPEALRLIYIEGESMKPTLSPGDIVMANLKDTMVRDGVFAVQMEDALLIKRLQQLSRDVIKVSSDNPDYESWTTNVQDLDQMLKIIGRVVRACRKL